jgi:hypothetical protein
MAIAKRATYTFIDEDSSSKTVRLRKWSVAKFVSLLGDVGDLLKLVGDDVKIDGFFSLPPSVLADKLVRVGEAAIEKLVRIVQESCEEPKFDDARVRELSMEDFLGVLANIIELNITEQLRKNFDNLKGKLSIAGGAAPQKETAPQAM